MKIRLLILVGLLIVTLIASGCTSSAPSGTGTSSSEGPFTLHVDSGKSGSVIANTYTCMGSSKSPEISWENVPPGTQGLALIVEDSDAPAGSFTHWIAYNVPPASNSIPVGQVSQKDIFNGGLQGINSAGKFGYYPPCPPSGPAHHYAFNLYAVDTHLEVQDPTRQNIDSAMTGHILNQSRITVLAAR
jgi:hypothetical protein